MKIAVSAVGDTPEHDVDARFGRCACFLFYDEESKAYEAVANDADTQAGGAGVAAAQLVKAEGAGVVLTGNAGPNAFSALKAAQIKVVVGVNGRVSEAVKKYLAGEYEEAESANVDPHFGMKGGS